MGINHLFWKNRKVLLTGHTGFKGSWLSLWLQRMGANVIGYSLPPPTTPNLFELANLEKKIVSIIGDIRDLKNIQTVIADHQPEIVFHLAAQSLVAYSYENPVETYSTNVMGTINVLESVRLSKCARVVIIVTSDKCYRNNEWIWGYREDEPMGGYDPYSSSKGCAELITAAYRNSYFSKINTAVDHEANIATARAGNVIGGGDWAENRLIPDIMKAVMEGRVVVIRNPDAVRPWQHVLEPLSGYLILGERLWSQGKNYAEAWNFGPHDKDAKPVSWVVEWVTKNWGEGARWELDHHRHPHEAKILKLDSSKAKAFLEWSPKWDIPTALEKTVEWYKSYKLGKNMGLFTEAQISSYEEMG